MRTSAHASTVDDMQALHPSSVDLYWIPLGAGGHSVRFNGRVFEAIDAARQHRPRRDLYHSALIVTLDDERYTIELAPGWDGNPASRGVVCTGAVGSRYLGWSRLFRYELRCWRGGSIPDLHYAVGGAQHLSSDPSAARRLLDLVTAVPTPVWGRDELKTGEMWNCNSVIAWLIATADIAAENIQPPAGGRAPGWNPGLLVATRNNPETRPGGEHAPLVAPHRNGRTFTTPTGYSRDADRDRWPAAGPKARSAGERSVMRGVGSSSDRWPPAHRPRRRRRQ